MLLWTILNNFINSNKIKLSTSEEREKDKMIEKLKDFLVYLEDKNLINSKIKDTKKLNQMVESLINSKEIMDRENELKSK